MPSWTQDEDETHFMNVDVDVWAKVPLDSLVAAFGDKVFVHYVGSEGKLYGAHFSLSGGDSDADRLTKQLVGLVSKLPRAARALWNRASSREFNVGIQAGIKPHSHEVRLEARTLAAISSVDGRLVVTTYAAETKPQATPRVKSRTAQQVNAAHAVRARPARRRGPRS